MERAVKVVHYCDGRPKGTPMYEVPGVVDDAGNVFWHERYEFCPYCAAKLPTEFPAFTLG